jgi:N-acetylmuramoyl-L-alanine amidase
LLPWVAMRSSRSTPSERRRRLAFTIALLLLLPGGTCALVPHAADPPPATDVECLALTLYWEAKAEGREGMQAVAWVVLNRVAHPAFPDSLCAVVQEGGREPPCQFSYWCDDRSIRPVEEEPWQLARDLAARMLAAPPPDPTGGALFFHSAHVTPGWTYERTVRIGDHVYYR